MWLDQLGAWLLQCTLSGAVILVFGAIATRLCREPIDRLCVIHWTFLACLVVPLLRHWELLPGIRLSVWPAPALSERSGGGESLLGDAPALGSFDATPANLRAEMSLRPALVNETTVGHEAAPSTTSAMASRSAASVPAAMTQQWSLADWLVAGCELAYAAALCGMGAFWVIGFFQRRRIERTSRPGSAGLRAVLESVAGDQRSQRTRLLVSDQIDAPIMWGIGRPTIVVPSALAADLQSAELRFGLAHEWSHVRRRDFVAYSLANIAKLVCFHQPVYWWLRKQLILGQDFLADAFAARQANMAEEYAQYLVSLARSRSRTTLVGSLGVRDRRSRLSERVRMLVRDEKPFRQRQGLRPALLIGAVAAVLVLTLGGVQLSAQSLEEEGQPAAAKPQPSAETKLPTEQPETPLPKPITYTGQVVDHETGEPIAGAMVEVLRSLNRDPKTQKWVTLETTEHLTDESGRYSFTLPPEQVAQSSLYLEVDAHHPDYQPKGRSGYAHSMILKNLENGEPPFYTTIKLFKGEKVFATVLKPDGSPAANLNVVAYTKAPGKEPGISFERGAFQKATTDERGVFQIVCATPGDGVIWIYPQEYSPLAIRIRDRRGDLGPIQLHEGRRISGQVLDARGEPVPNVAVEITRRGDGDEADEFLGRNAVANGIRVAAKTDSQGRFELSPLPPGTYRAVIEDRFHPPGAIGSSEELSVNDVFVPLEVTLTAEAAPRPLEIRAVPHVILRGRFFNSRGEPRASHQQHVFAKFNGQFMFAQSTAPGKDGWFEFKLPHGVEDVQISFTTNEHSALRWRLRPNEPLQYGHRGHLEKLEEDFTTLEVIRYEAPILLLKAVDEQGNQLRDFVPNSKYKTRPAEEMGGKFISGAHGDIGFESQPDGRWRSSQMLPDEDVTITLQKEGYTCEPQTISLKEGTTRELVFVLKPQTAETSKASSDASKQ